MISQQGSTTGEVRAVEERIQQYLHSLGLTHSARSFVALVSNLYHKFESEVYDQVHLELYEATDYWVACLSSIAPLLPASICVLDLGAGTGFAAEQVVKVLGDRVAQLVCLDLSYDMAIKCRSRIGLLTRRACYVCGEAQCLLGWPHRFDLVITNAVLHHLIDLPAFFDVIRKLVRPGGFYVAGHEPSSSFYLDRKVYRWTKAYQLWKRLRHLASPQPYLRRVGILPFPKSIEKLTNEALKNMCVIDSYLPWGVIPKLVDIHVPVLSTQSPFWGECGFNSVNLCQKYLPNFELCFMMTYPHIKDVRARMGPIWRAVERGLARKYPTSGANFVMAARRVE